MKRSGLLTRSTRLKNKRETPRRDEGRVKHGRTKPKASDGPTPEERRHMERVAALPCLVTGRSPVQLHHVTATIHGGRITRSHKRIVPLVPELHQHDHGMESVERLGHRGFFERHGIDLLAEADQLWQESARLGVEPTRF